MKKTVLTNNQHGFFSEPDLDFYLRAHFYYPVGRDPEEAGAARSVTHHE